MRAAGWLTRRRGGQAPRQPGRRSRSGRRPHVPASGVGGGWVGGGIWGGMGRWAAMWKRAQQGGWVGSWPSPLRPIQHPRLPPPPPSPHAHAHTTNKTNSSTTPDPNLPCPPPDTSAWPGSCRACKRPVPGCYGKPEPPDYLTVNTAVSGPVVTGIPRAAAACGSRRGSSSGAGCKRRLPAGRLPAGRLPTGSAPGSAAAGLQLCTCGA